MNFDVNAIISFFTIIVCIAQLHCQATKSRALKKPVVSCYVIKVLHKMFCAIWYLLHNLQNVKHTHGRVLLLVKMQVIKMARHILKVCWNVSGYYALNEHLTFCMIKGPLLINFTELSKAQKK